MSVPPPVRMSEETLARQVYRLAPGSGLWPLHWFGDKIEPIEDEV